MGHDKWIMGVSASDFHFPFQDNRVVSLFLEFLKDNADELKYLILNGDILDCWEISKFDKVPRTGKALKEELKEAKDFLTKIREILPKTQIVFIEGNHEFRLRSYIIRNAKELWGLEGLSIAEQLHLKDLNIIYKESLPGLNHFSHLDFKIGELYIGHYNKVNKHAGYTAKCLIEDLGVSFIQGHTHRFGICSKTLRSGQELIGIEQGCLCSLRPNYISFPNWQHGFSVFFKKENYPRFQVYPIRIPDYGFFWGHKEYKVDRNGRLC